MRSSVIILVLLAATASADSDVAPTGAPAALRVYGCRADGANRSCLECTPDATGGQFCERCTRTPEAAPLACRFPDAADVRVLSASGVTASRNPNWTWRPRPAFQTFACTIDRSCLECEPDGYGGTFCERCKRRADDGIDGTCSLGDADRAELATHGITPSARRPWSTWNPWTAPVVAVLPPNLATGQLPGITEYSCTSLASRDERVCQECQANSTGGTACMRVLRDAKLQPLNSWPLQPFEVETFASRGITVANAPVAVATQPTTTAGGQTTPAPGEQAPAVKDRAYHHRRRGVSFGIEVGQVRPDDGQNIYGSGYGRGWVFGYWIVELRLESYDLPDRSKTYDNVFDANARFSVYSLAARPTLVTLGPLELTALVGAALVLRPSMRMDPDDLVSASMLRSQWGGALLVGAGVRLYDVLTVDVRAYPTSWMEIGGVRAELDANSALTYVPLAASPGGTPITLNVGAGWAF